MSLKSIQQKLDKIEKGEIVMTQQDWDALIKEATNQEDLQKIYLELIKHDKFYNQKWLKAKSPNAC